MKQFLFKMQYNERVQKSVHRLKGSLAVQSITRYSVTAFYSCEGGAFIFHKIALRVRTYYLRKALLDELFQISSKGPAMDGLVFLAVVKRAVLLRSNQ